MALEPTIGGRLEFKGLGLGFRAQGLGLGLSV